MPNLRFLHASALLLLGLVGAPAMAQSASHFDQPILRHVNLTLRFDPSTACPTQRTFFERFPSGNLTDLSSWTGTISGPQWDRRYFT